MQIFKLSAIALTLATGTLFTANVYADTLQKLADSLNTNQTKSLSYSGNGKWFQFGQAPAPALPWPQFDLNSYNAEFNYDQSAAHIQTVRIQTVEANRQRPTPVEQRSDQFIQANTAWNQTLGANQTPVFSLQKAAVEERNAEIWSTPQGFVKAALAHQASSKALKGGATEVSFKVDNKYQYTGLINAKNELVSVKTWIANPVLGDTLFETRFSNYQQFAGVSFPSHIVRLQGGFPVLDLNVNEVKLNPVVEIKTPSEIAQATPAAINVSVKELASGVYHFTGGTHHSVIIEQNDHIVVVEAPQNEERSLAVIEKIKQTIPGKPIKYLINTHAHFDHSGGLRTYVDAGAKIVTHKTNQAYYKKIWASSHTLNPDQLARSKKAAQFETFNAKHVITDGKRKIEIYPIAGNSHNDAFALVYLPNEKILVEADAYNPIPATAKAPVPANPYSVNLYDNIQKLKLEVDQIAGLHGPSAVKLADLRSYIGLN